MVTGDNMRGSSDHGTFNDFVIIGIVRNDFQRISYGNQARAQENLYRHPCCLRRGHVSFPYQNHF